MTPLPPSPSAPLARREVSARGYWLVWGALCQGWIVLSLFLPDSSRASVAPALYVLPLLPFFVAAAVRWVLLPRLTQPHLRFPLFILGLSLAEAAGLLTLLLLPESRLVALVLGLVGMAQFTPAFLPAPRR